MKKVAFFGLLLGGILWGCNNAKEIQNDHMDISGFNLGDTTTVNLNDIVLCNDDLDLFVQFDTIFSDSRCPHNASCIWEGNAEVGLSITYNKELDTMRLNTNPKMDQAKVAYGYKFQLVKLMPYPGEPGADAIKTAIQLLVTKE